MTDNPLQQALGLARQQEAAGGRPVRNLVESSFHAAGLLPPPEPLARAFADWLAQRHYQPRPEGREECLKSIQDYYIHQSRQSATLNRPLAASTLCTASSSESYSLIFSEFCQPGDNLLLPLPSYPLFEDLAAYAGLEPRFYPLDPARNWAPDLEVLDALVDDRTRLVVLISPNNPCGSVLDEAQLQEVLAICAREGLMLVWDEVFSEFLYPPLERLPRPWELSPGVPVFTLNGISKMYASPDLKLGWIMVSSGPDRDSAPGFPPVDDLVQRLALRSDTYLNANDFSQFLLPYLRREAGDFVAGLGTRLDRAREDLLASPLPDLPDWRLIPPAGGIHFVLSHRSRSRCPDDEALAIRLVSRNGLYVHPGYLYGLDEGCHLVLSLLGGLDGQNWHRLARALTGETAAG